MPKTESPRLALIMIDEVRKTLTESEQREWKALERTTSQMWRSFWIRAAQRAGYSNRKIAHIFEISEGTVRAVLRGER